MNIRDYRVPANPGEVLCDPPLERWGEVAASQRQRAASWPFHVMGIPAPEFRRQVRERLWGPGGGGGPTIVTGHQPVLFHAGVWIKAFAVRRAVERVPGAVGWHVNVDSDEARDIGVWLPLYDQAADRWGRRWVALGAPSPYPLERRPAPSPEAWEAFIRRGAAALASLPEGNGRDGLLARWERFAAVGRRLLEGGAPQAPGSMGAFLAACRQAVEAGREGGDGNPLLPETSVSRWAETREFLLFALAWMQEADRLARVYNGQLALYRRARRYRSRVNPFPDLRRYGAQIEVPFWCAEADGTRADLFVIPGDGGRRVVLTTRFGEKLGVALDDPERAVAELAGAGLAIRPKAVPLTLFLRMFASDLFVHGVGGGRYDHITDGVIRGWWGVEPPQYAVVSATLPLFPEAAGAAGGNPGPAADPAYWQQQLRALQFNPQRFVDPSGREAVAGGPGGANGEEARHRAGLRAEKEALVRAINEPGAPKRDLTRRIEAVNEALKGHLARVEGHLAARLEEAQRLRQRQAVLLARDYPFFLYDPQLLEAGLQAAPEKRVAGCPC